MFRMSESKPVGFSEAASHLMITSFGLDISHILRKTLPPSAGKFRQVHGVSPVIPKSLMESHPMQS